MDLQELLGNLKEKEFYQKFSKNNPSSFLTAVFSIVDIKNKTHQTQFNFYIPQEKKLASFEHPFEKEEKIYEDEVREAQEQIIEDIINLRELELHVNESLEKNKSKLFPTKIIAILKENIWNLTCMDDSLGIVRIKLDAKTGEEKEFSKGSLMDFMGIQKKK